MRILSAVALLAVLASPGAAAAVEPAPLEGAPRLTVADVVERGDSAFARGDLRAALFAYQDAVLLDGASASARIKLARAYLAMGYPAQARIQAERAQELDAGSAEARRLLEDAIAGRAPPPRAVAGEGTGGRTDAGAGAAAARDDASSRGDRAGPSRGLAAEAHRDPPEAPTGEPTEAALRYRAGVDLLVRRDYAAAVEALDLAIAADGQLGIAYAARGSARLGLGRIRDAARDYRAALELEPGLAMPLYGLAECYRFEGDPRAADLYRRYAESPAADVREDLRTLAVRRVGELVGR